MARRLVLLIPPEAAGERLDRFLVALASSPGTEASLAGLSRSRIQQLIEAGQVTIDGAAVRPSHRLRGGEQLTVAVPEPQPLGIVAEPMPLVILFEDEHLVAVAKPAGLAVHPGAGRRTGTLVHGLLAHCRDLSGIGGVERPGIVHRLDRDTSGVIVVAKHDRAHQGLATQFARREVVKRYVAFVLGVPEPPRATIDTSYGRHPTQRVRFSSRVRQGKRAITSYAVELAAGGLSRLAVGLGTGRTHQIRVHLSERGHPIVGDRLYGGTQYSRIQDPELRELAHGLGRQALHAARLELAHPVTGEPLVLEAVLPEELQALWRAMQHLASGKSP